MKSFDYIYELNKKFDKSSETYKKIWDNIYRQEKSKRKDERAILKKVNRKFFSKISQENIKNINVCYIPFFLNIGKLFEGAAEKEIYKEEFNSLKAKFNRTFLDSKKFMNNIVNFENELQNIRLLKTKWAILRCQFRLEEVYFSRDDSAFYVIDNPLKKDKVFKIPYIAPSTWKGMLRWVATKLYGKKYKENIKRIFGFEKGSDEEEHAGALRIYPSFFYEIDIEIINPMDRKSRKGTNPITFEVVPKGAESEVILTYIPNFAEQHYIDQDLEIIQNSLKKLIQEYGISAKRSSGWGKAQIINFSVERG